MTTQSILAMKTVGTTQAYRLVGATSSTLGSAFGSAESSSGTNPNTATYVRANNRILQWQYGNGSPQVILIAAVGQTIYTYDGSTWTLRYTFAGTALGSGLFRSGLHIVNVAGVPTIIGTYTDASGNWRGYRSTDGINWIETAILQTFGDANATCEIIFNNVFCYLAAGAKVVTWDPSSNVSTSSGQVTNMTSFGARDFMIYGGNLFILAEKDTPNAGYYIWALSGGSWVTVAQLATPGNGSPVTVNSVGSSVMTDPILFDGGDGFAYAIYENFHSNTAYGYACAKLAISGTTVTPTDITATVLPASMLYSASTPPGHLVFSVVVETESSLTTPTVHIFQTAGVSSSNWNYYLWNGPSTLIGSGGSPNDTGGDVSMRIPNVKDGSGDRIWTTSDFDVHRVAAPMPESGGLDYFFRAYGPLGTEAKFVQLYHSEGLQIPTGICTLSAPAALATTVASGSNGQSLPQSTVNVASNAGFIPPMANTTIAAGSNTVTLPTGTINVASNVGFAKSGTIYVQTSAATSQAVAYTGLSGTTQFTGCTGGTGTMSTGGIVSSQLQTFFVKTNANATTIAAGSNGVALPTGTIHAVATAGFPSSGVILVTTGSGTYQVQYTGISSNDFTGCTGGLGTMATGGAIAGMQAVTFLALSGATQFIGCAGGSGAMATGGNVLSGPAADPTLHAGNQQLDGVVCDGNTATPSTYKVKWEAQTDGVNANQKTRLKSVVL
jgi:hypothetical protein